MTDFELNGRLSFAFMTKQHRIATRQARSPRVRLRVLAFEEMDVKILRPTRDYFA